MVNTREIYGHVSICNHFRIWMFQGITEVISGNQFMHLKTRIKSPQQINALLFVLLYNVQHQYILF